MKLVGMNRPVDELGRIVIPKELRDRLGIKEKSPLEIYVEDEKIIFKKYEADGTCAITGEVSNQNISLANGKIILSSAGVSSLVTELEQYLIK
ncbi:AbrB family transcriptional regulator [[Bacillus thuringiensis] serovar konkukian]|nr:AbrB/MazE/SpoVT family DNA-binding domain-containing protein [Bacillus thuringiensis]ANN35581.1 AbrB family transcriptional regulator [Bacillus thuringiensis serovar coreanensis]MED1305044.1 AbrB/MazE/SpoVT family DNA-binding domain-containing protein [Bacillus pacificus]OUB07552.1 AbrB family transcriptional regulator [[Bacillus thuringiensis] serovar konkukian]